MLWVPKLSIIRAANSLVTELPSTHEEHDDPTRPYNVWLLIQPAESHLREKTLRYAEVRLTRQWEEYKKNIRDLFLKIAYTFGYYKANGWRPRAKEAEKRVCRNFDILEQFWSSKIALQG